MSNTSRAAGAKIGASYLKSVSQMFLESSIKLNEKISFVAQCDVYFSQDDM